MSLKWLKEYFTFTLKERIAILLLLGLILFVFFLPQLIPSRSMKPDPKEVEDFHELARKIHGDSIDSTEDQQYSQFELLEPSRENAVTENSLFLFDPNTASFNQWEKLGLREKTIKTIQNYLSKGGSFHKPEDLKKIYGLREQDYLRLEPYVRIALERKKEFTSAEKKDPSPKIRDSLRTVVKGRNNKIPIIELNNSDTSALIMLPGIGGRLANRIINFRNRLGGFYSVDQVGETYGLPDSTFQKIKPFLILGSQPVLRININMADAARLKQHPYISWAAANALVAYRQEHGPFQRVEDILRVQAILPEQLKRLIPYLSID
ncbi:MAG TPA: helix-hairpin-helix domain-containing protein [Chitinophagaceae bacterium]|nr:helix-hairpin-helix domain-containing protein [Chitinophagaceae bacterium]